MQTPSKWSSTRPNYNDHQSKNSSWGTTTMRLYKQQNQTATLIQIRPNKRQPLSTLPKVLKTQTLDLLTISKVALWLASVTNYHLKNVRLITCKNLASRPQRAATAPTTNHRTNYRTSQCNKISHQQYAALWGATKKVVVYSLGFDFDFV
jgi:hypothetical protein